MCHLQESSRRGNIFLILLYLVQTLFHRVPWVIKSSIDKITGRKSKYSLLSLPHPSAAVVSTDLCLRPWNSLAETSLLIKRKTLSVCYSVTASNTGQVWLLFAAKTSAPRWATRFRYHLKYPARNKFHFSNVLPSACS